MKKNLWIWALAALSIAACTDEEMSTQDQVVTENDWISPDGQVVVQLGAESRPTAVISRAEGGGPIEGAEITELKNLGIFAINRDETIDDTEWGHWPNIIDNCLLKNVKASGTEKNPLDTLVNKGKRLTLYNTKADKQGYVYYYPIQGSQNFDFYGYQPRVDSMQLVGGKINVIMTLNGNVDLITGEAPSANTVDSLYTAEATATDAAKWEKNPINGYNAKYIRKIKYHNWIIDESQNLASNKLDTLKKKPFIPNIGFEHRLTKLNFQIITSREQAGGGMQSDSIGGDRQEATKLRVKDIKLKNVRPYATLTIDKNMPLTFSGDTVLAMIPMEGTTVWEGDSLIKPQNYENTPYISAGYLMVPPTNSPSINYNDNPYRISLKVKSTNSVGIPEIQNIELELKDKTGNLLQFLPGKSYNIRITLYALQEVNVSATLTPWDLVEDEIEIPVE